jgi:Kdo2-lipid IVA lauroyltransferase/acyltransferase
MTAPPSAVAPDVALAAAPRAPRPVVARHRFEYGALRALLGGFGTLGFRNASAVGARLGRLGHAPFKVRRRVVETQIAAAFPDWSRDRVEAVARAAYENLGRTTMETAVLSRYPADRLLELFDECPTWPVLERAIAKGKGVILVAGHLANWELAASYIAGRGVRIQAVARQMENPLFDDYLNRTRRRLGVDIVWDGDAVRRVPRTLREGGVVAFLIDQGAVGLASTWVPFFGRYAKTPRGPAVFALRLGAPVVFAAPLRQPDGRFTMSFEDVQVHITGDRTADVDRIVADATAILERWVRRAPEQYFWHHRRWKHQRPDTPKELGDPL